MADPCEHTKKSSVARTGVAYLDYVTYYQIFIYTSTFMESV
jgi:hypothetical protein